MQTFDITLECNLASAARRLADLERFGERRDGFIDTLQP